MGREDRRKQDRRGRVTEDANAPNTKPALRTLLKRENRQADRRVGSPDRSEVHVDTGTWESLDLNPKSGIRPNALVDMYPEQAENLREIARTEVSQELHNRAQSLAQSAPPTPVERYNAAQSLIKEWQTVRQQRYTIKDITEEQRGECHYAGLKAEVITRLFLPAIVESLSPEEKKELGIEETKRPYASSSTPDRGAPQLTESGGPNAETPKPKFKRKLSTSQMLKRAAIVTGVTGAAVTGFFATNPPARQRARAIITSPRKALDWELRLAINDFNANTSPILPPPDPDQVARGEVQRNAFQSIAGDSDELNNPLDFKKHMVIFPPQATELFPEERKAPRPHPLAPRQIPADMADTPQKLALKLGYYNKDKSGTPNYTAIAEVLGLHKDDQTPDVERVKLDPHFQDNLYLPDGKPNPHATVLAVTIGTPIPQLARDYYAADPADRQPFIEALARKDQRGLITQRPVFLQAKTVEQYQRTGKLPDPENKAIMSGIKHMALHFRPPPSGIGGYMPSTAYDPNRPLTKQFILAAMLPHEPSADSKSKGEMLDGDFISKVTDQERSNSAGRSNNTGR